MSSSSAIIVKIRIKDAANYHYPDDRGLFQHAAQGKSKDIESEVHTAESMMTRFATSNVVSSEPSPALPWGWILAAKAVGAVSAVSKLSLPALLLLTQCSLEDGIVP